MQVVVRRKIAKTLNVYPPGPDYVIITATHRFSEAENIPRSVYLGSTYYWFIPNSLWFPACLKVGLGISVCWKRAMTAQTLILLLLMCFFHELVTIYTYSLIFAFPFHVLNWANLFIWSVSQWCVNHKNYKLHWRFRTKIQGIRT